MPDNAAARSDFTSGLVVTDTGISMYDLNNQVLTYRYDVVNQRLLAITGGQTYTMAEGVTQFTREDGADAESTSRCGPAALGPAPPGDDHVIGPEQQQDDRRAATAPASR